MTIAAIDSAETSCTVTVIRASKVGTLTTDYSSLDLLVGKSVEVRASVTFNGGEAEVLSFEWTSENETIASAAAEENKTLISGLTPGTTSVSCVHFGENLTEKISVSVRNDVSISVENFVPVGNKYALTLVKSEPSEYAGTGKREFSPVFSVTVDVKEIESPDVKVEIPASANSVVRYEEETNRLAAVGVGTAEISFVYETGGTKYEVSAEVSVILPEIIEEKVFDLEISEGSALRRRTAKNQTREKFGKKGGIILMDEPTIGLPSDIQNFLKLFESIVAHGSTWVVIEHNLDVIKQAGWITDIGPEGGKNDGEVVFAGTPAEMLRSANTLTADCLRASCADREK